MNNQQEKSAEMLPHVIKLLHIYENSKIRTTTSELVYENPNNGVNIRVTGICALCGSSHLNNKSLKFWILEELLHYPKAYLNLAPRIKQKLIQLDLLHCVHAFTSPLMIDWADTDNNISSLTKARSERVEFLTYLIKKYNEKGSSH